MTVKEARTKVCPFIQDGRVLLGERQNYSESITSNITCICGDCMAWESIESNNYTQEMTEWMEKDITRRIGKTAKELNEWYEKNPPPDEQTTEEGYCKRLQ